MGGELLKISWCCCSYLLEERGKPQERIISEGTRNTISLLAPNCSNEAYLGAQDMFITHCMHHLGDLFMPKQKVGSGPREWEL